MQINLYDLLNQIKSDRIKKADDKAISSAFIYLIISYLHIITESISIIEQFQYRSVCVFYGKCFGSNHKCSITKYG